ncbi:MAG: Gfo/Idh/MocA family oxidoreductase [Sedimentisphaerales bacterium]|nr:Gfo/Idh/MocA family oxidoreductase [Sedimentisphaerales bacterium]
MKTNGVSRRSFLRTSAAAGVAIVMPTVVPASVFGANPPSERIVMGAIGVGSMGQGDLNGFLHKDEVQVVAVCDADRNHITQAKQMVDGRYNTQDCKGYLDYRELLGRGDLDAMMHALPDHWHGIVSVDCARAGMDIHGQKPLARTIGEGRAICEAVDRYGRIWQTGSWQRSVAHFHRACELVINGRIGKVKYVEVGLPNGGQSPVFPKRPVPENLNWNWWLGPAPWREYTGFDDGGSVHWNWRWVMDYSGGQLTDWAGHHIDIAHWGLGLDRTGPVGIEGRGEYPKDGTYDAPYAYKFTCTYANGLEMVVANAGQQPHGMGACWYGDKGWIHVSRGGLSAGDEKILKEVIGPNEIHLYKSNDHLQNFLDCVKTRKETITPAEIAHRSISVALLGEIAMLTGRKIQWDPEKEEIHNDPAASAMLKRAHREPWTL